MINKYKNNFKHGFWVNTSYGLYYDSNFKERFRHSVGYYKDGLMVGYWKFYSKNRISSEGCLNSNGQLCGLWKKYIDGDLVILEYFYK